MSLPQSLLVLSSLPLLPLLLLLLLEFPGNALCVNSTVRCEQGEEEDCSKCFAFLVEQVTQHDRNFFEIQNAFFPPNNSAPVFVTVTYHYQDDGGLEVVHNETWFWSTAIFYVWQPLNVFQFTSLLFSDTLLHTAEANLVLPARCAEASMEHKRLLTQRVSVVMVSTSACCCC